MKPRSVQSRSAAAAFFVVFCLLLCGMILRRQIAEHPLPPERTTEASQGQSGGLPGFMTRHIGWQAATASDLHQAQAVIGGQLDALRAGDGVKAMSYQSTLMRRQFGDPAYFVQRIRDQYPEFGQSQAVMYGPMLTDSSGQQIATLVLVRGQNGNRAVGEYTLIRENGRLKIAMVQTRPHYR